MTKTNSGDAVSVPKSPAMTDTAPVRRERVRRAAPMLIEVAWEVCNQLGGIYTVLRSKAPSMMQAWGDRYLMLGPYHTPSAAVEFEPSALTGAVGRTVRALRDQGLQAHYGRWLVTGSPRVVLLDHLSIFHRLHEVKYRLWKDHGIGTPGENELINNVVGFGELCRIFLQLLVQKTAGHRPLLAHFHEWMSAAAVPMLRRDQWPGSMVFTTHATLLGRYLAMNDHGFYQRLGSYDPDHEARRFNVEPQYRLERAAAHGSHVFTTVSDVTAEECRSLLGRTPEILLPNGLNIQRFTALHEFQNLHRIYKEKIHQFTIGHFFPSYHFDLDKTIYLFTAGRYEYRNKGMDLTIEALARLNHRLRQDMSPVTVVAFLITRRPVRSINVTALQSNAMLDEFRTTIKGIHEQVGEKLMREAVTGRIPDLNALVDEYWLLRLRRTMHAWRRDMPPGIVTHDLVDDVRDEVLNQLRVSQLWNQKHDPVKVIYHPDFITTANPLFGLEYEQFVRGCHLGVFPSYYEPWGYTPLESIALGVPAITSDLSGFGSYLQQILPDHEEHGLSVVRRRHASFDDAARDLTDRLYRICQLNRRERITLRNKVESFSVHFDWTNLAARYHEAHQLALERIT